MLMAIADKSGSVLGTDEAIARIINVPIEEFTEALTALMAPDADSQSKEHDGRRIVRLDGIPGLFLVNYVKYAEIGSEEQRREYFRTAKAKSRAKQKEENGQSDVKSPVKDKFVKPTKEELNLHAAKIGLPASEVDKFINHYESNGWKVGKNAMKSWQFAMSGWKTRWEEAGRPMKTVTHEDRAMNEILKLGAKYDSPRPL